MKWTAICSATQANAGSWRHTNFDIENQVREEIQLNTLCIRFRRFQGELVRQESRQIIISEGSDRLFVRKLTDRLNQRIKS